MATNIQMNILNSDKTTYTTLYPETSASQISSGTFDSARIPNLTASKITSGIFDVARIPNLTYLKYETIEYTGAYSSMNASSTKIENSIQCSINPILFWILSASKSASVPLGGFPYSELYGIHMGSTPSTATTTRVWKQPNFNGDSLFCVLYPNTIQARIMTECTNTGVIDYGLQLSFSNKKITLSVDMNDTKLFTGNKGYWPSFNHANSKYFVFVIGY